MDPRDVGVGRYVGRLDLRRGGVLLAVNLSGQRFQTDYYRRLRPSGAPIATGLFGRPSCAFLR